MQDYSRNGNRYSGCQINLARPSDSRFTCFETFKEFSGQVIRKLTGEHTAKKLRMLNISQQVLTTIRSANAKRKR